jgi:hypothetical protein
MGSTVTMDVIAASAGLQPFLQTTPWEGQIIAVFHRSILCTAPDEHLLHLHTGPRLTSPFSLRIEGNFANVLRASPFVQGMPVRKIDLTIEIAEDLHLGLDRTTYYRSPRRLSGAVEPEGVRHVRQILKAYGRAGGFDRLLNAQATVTAIKQALADKHSAQLLYAARHVIGLGPGLTPSGDDFLVGCLRGLSLLRTSVPGACQMFSCLREALFPDLNARTTRVGAEFIRYALDGAFAEVLDQVALALLAPSYPEVVQSAVSHLLAQGETSGTDTMLGLLTCLEALLSILDIEPHHAWQYMPATFSTSIATRG